VLTKIQPSLSTWDVQVGKNKARRYSYEYLKSHACVDCGEVDPEVLTFDHVRGKKTDNVSRMVSKGMSIKKIAAEISKCDVRCFNCHARKTARDFNWYKDLK